jgi:hypothetical protein
VVGTDLGEAKDIEKISVWNRSGFENRLHGFTLTLLDADRKEVFSRKNVAARRDSKLTSEGAASCNISPTMASPVNHSTKSTTRRGWRSRSKAGAPLVAMCRPIIATRCRLHFRRAMSWPFWATAADRMQHDGWMETLLQSQLQGKASALPQHERQRRPPELVSAQRRRDVDDGVPAAYVKADVVFAFFGYNESFDGKAGRVQKKLLEFVQRRAARKPNGKNVPAHRAVQPIAHEDTRNPNVPDGKAHNVQLEAYTQGDRSGGQRSRRRFVDLFHPTLELFEEREKPLTINGVHLTDEGNRQLAEVIAFCVARQTGRASPSLEPLRQAVLDKDCTGTTATARATATTSGAAAPR